MTIPRLDWPQTALVLGLGAIAVLALIYAPAEYHAPIGAALTLAVGVLRSIVASPARAEAPRPLPGQARVTGVRLMAHGTAEIDVEAWPWASGAEPANLDVHSPIGSVRNIEPIRLDGVRGTTLTVFCRDSTSLGLICADDWLVPHGTPTTRADRSLLRPARTHRTTIAPSALVTLALLVAGCSPSALRTHSTIATVARVGVVAAHPAIVRACESALAACTDDACLERVGADCRTAAAARDTAHEAVAAYVDAIEIAARADEGAVGPALSNALDVVVHAYEAARVAIRAVTGYDLPALPPAAIEIVRALIGGAS